jgi:hypothetical protein
MLKLVTPRLRARTPAALAVLAALLLVAPPIEAIDVPQTPEEFKSAVAKGARGAKVETVVIERPFEEVYRALEARTSPCLDVTVKRSSYVGYHERSSSDFNPKLRRIGPDRAEFTLQVAHNPRGVGHTPPPEGLYMMAVDLKRVGPARTEVVLYSPTIGYYKRIPKSFVSWAEGASTECPKMK